MAAGTSESYVRVWTVDGKPLTGATSNGTAGADKLSSSRRLIGHSGPVYGVSFSPAIAQSVEDGPTTNARYLISCSADKSVRLWSLETWSCLVVYKGHDNPVWDVTWGPFGHYFATASHDRTARLWSTDNVAPLRIFAGHDNDVDHVVFHPNGAYIFTGSSDKTVRMWDVSRGNPVRLFTGHTGNITALSCAPNGRTLASADDQGSIILWELGLGRRIKRMRGHAKGGIWSLAWSAESTVLVSGGADCVLRVWDSLQTTSESTGVLSAGLASSGTASTPTANGKNLPDGNNGVIKTEGIPTTAGPGGGGNAPIASAAAGAGGGKRGKGAKEVVVSADQISAFPTKKSPIYQVYFTRMNLVLAGGAYLP